METDILSQFRETLYQNLDNRADAIFELLDALSSNQGARSPVELSLSPLFRRQYPSVYTAIEDFHLDPEVYRELLGMIAPDPEVRPFWLFSTDATPHPRPYAKTLADRSYVHAPTPLKSNKPVTVGHAYSTVVILPEKEAGEAPWVIPASVRRVNSQEDTELVGAEQLDELLTDPSMPWHGELIVHVGDTSYSKPAFLWHTLQHPNLVDVVRVRNNRVFYWPYQPDPKAKKGRGRPRVYGERFALNEPETWPEPDERYEWQEKRSRGRTHTISIQAWDGLLMQGKRDMPMHRRPFILVQVEERNQEGKLVHRRPLWFIIIGHRRHEVYPKLATQAYRQRFDHEHFLRFGKRNLLFTAYQTPEAEREEAWWQLGFLAYRQLWAARDLAEVQWRPWERYGSATRRLHLSPSQVQRDFSRIIGAIGTPARPPKRRGKSPGRPLGYRLPPRQRHKVVRKGKKKRKKAV